MPKKKVSKELTDDDIPNINVKRERFAQEYVANGGDASAAYRTIFEWEHMQQDSIWSAAYRIKSGNQVQARIKQIRKEHEKACIATTQWRLSELIDGVEMAKRKGSTYGLVQAVNEINKMLGGHKTSDLGDVQVSINTEATIPPNSRDTGKTDG